MVHWDAIETVLLDMDGTLLDLHYDNHFWQRHVPERYAEKYDLDFDTAYDQLMQRYEKAAGTLEWYCVDYWTQQLGLDIAQLKAEVDHLITIHPHVVDFLKAIRRTGKRTVLVTNAHGKSLSLKMDRTRLGGHFDKLICAHDLGLAKEMEGFWGRFQQIEPFIKSSALLIDDSLSVLDAARRYGIQHLISIKKPDSRAKVREVQGYDAIDSFRDIMP